MTRSHPSEASVYCGCQGYHQTGNASCGRGRRPVDVRSGDTALCAAAASSTAGHCSHSCTHTTYEEHMRTKCEKLDTWLRITIHIH